MWRILVSDGKEREVLGKMEILEIIKNDFYSL